MTLQEKPKLCFSIVATTTRFTTAFRLPARQTASVELLPTPGLTLAPIGTASLEVRGFAVLSLSALLDLGSLIPSLG